MMTPETKVGKSKTAVRTKGAAVRVQRMVRRLFEARQSASAAKKAMQLKAAEVGKCSGYMDEYSACYQSRKPKEEWCDICQVKLPLWEERQRTAAQSGAALRELLRVARTLPPNIEVSGRLADDSRLQPGREPAVCSTDGF